jgi:hypothetical protein
MMHWKKRWSLVWLSKIELEREVMHLLMAVRHVVKKFWAKDAELTG